LQPGEVKTKKAKAALLYLQAKCRAVPLGVNRFTSMDGHFNNNLTTLKKNTKMK